MVKQGSLLLVLAAVIGAVLLTVFHLVYPQTPVTAVATLAAAVSLLLAAGLLALYNRKFPKSNR